MPLFTPTERKKDVSQITVELLQTMGIRGLLLDVVNTLSEHDSQEPFPAALQWTRDLREAGLQIVIVSNNHAPRVEPFAKKFDLPFVAEGKKPLPTGFRKGLDVLGMKQSEVLVVGDQIFTDILGANLGRMPSILVEPIQPEDGWFFRCKRALEKPILAYDSWRRRKK